MRLMACMEMTGKRKKHNGKEGRGQQFPSTNFSSVLTVCAEQRAAKQGLRRILNILKCLTCVQNKHCGVNLAKQDMSWQQGVCVTVYGLLDGMEDVAFPGRVPSERLARC